MRQVRKGRQRAGTFSPFLATRVPLRETWTPPGAQVRHTSVDVTDARNAGDEQVGEIVAGRVTRTQRRCGDSTGNPATFHPGTAARRQDAGLGVQ